MSRLNTNLCGVDFKNPIITASGTYNFAHEFKQFYSVSRLGGVALKGLTLEPREGNDSPRIAETYGGILNSVGLQNPGVQVFKKNYLPSLRQENVVLIANIAGNTEADYIRMAQEISDSSVDMIELNISCPNVKAGGLAFGVTANSVEKIVGAVKIHCNKPLIVKLTPNVANIADNARAAEASGANAVSLINTVAGMAINYKTRRPILANITGGLSGPCIKPIALKMVYDCYRAIKIPIIGMGGITKFSDAIEFMLAGASAVQIGTANLTNPFVAMEIINDLEEYCVTNNIENITQIVGKLEV